jgi:uncharacterized protein YdeI (YjbR/CyaY-like superfamily)
VKIPETLYVTNRKDWRAWLKRNHKKKKEIWLIYYKRHTSKPRIPYDDAVEEALCFGWIDSIVQKLDDEKYIQKFTPRKSGSRWSQLNIRRVKNMIREKRMTKAGLALFKKTEQKNIDTPIAKRTYTIPPDLRKALTQNKKALENFNNFAPSYKKLYVLWILDGKRKETRAKRIRRVVERSARNEKPGML